MPANIHDEYRFFYNHPTQGELQCYPANNQLEWAWEKEDDQIFFRKKLETTLTFVNDDRNQIDDFDQLYSIDRSEDRCSKIFFRIERQCVESWRIEWEGYLALVDGDFDVDRCKLSIKPRINDQYSCILERYEKEYNFLNASDIITLESEIDTESFTCREFAGYFNTRAEANQYVDEQRDEDGNLPLAEQCVDIINGGSVDPPAGFPDTFTPTSRSYFLEEEQGGEFNLYWSTTYRRERIVVNCNNGVPEDPPGGPGNWTLLEGCNDGTPGEAVYVRPVITYLGTFNIPDLPNGRSLEQVIEYMTDGCISGVKSDFFSINGVGDAPDNEAYDYAIEFLAHPVLFQNTDAKKPNATEKASIGKITLKEMFEFLREKMNVYWIVDDNDTLIIEHVSFFEKDSRMLDLLQDNAIELIRGNHRYSYDSESLPKSEKWTPAGEVNDADFGPLTVDYSEACSFVATTEEEKKLVWNTNVVDILENPDKYPDSGVTLVASLNNSYIWKLLGEFSQEVRLNGPMAMSNSFVHFLQHDRPHRSGDVDEATYEFYSHRRNRLQEDLKVKICCDDLATFDPVDLVKSQLGWGEVEEATFKAPHDLLTLNLRHYD